VDVTYLKGNLSLVLITFFSSILLFSLAFGVVVNEPNQDVIFHGSNDYVQEFSLNITDGNVTNNTLTGWVCNGNQCNFSIIIDNDQYNESTSFFNLFDFNITNVYYKISGLWRNITELGNIGQGNWSFSKTQVNFTLAGGDGFDYGIRDSQPGGSYWIDENGNSLESGLVGYWKFAKGSGGNVSDSSGNNNTGYVNGPTWITNSSCKFGNCLSFGAHGSGEYVKIGDDTNNLQDFAFMVGDGAVFSVCSWVKPVSEPTQWLTIFSSWNNAATSDKGAGIILINSATANKLDFGIKQVDGSSFYTDVTKTAIIDDDNEWHHLCWTHDESQTLENHKIYVDSVSTTTNTNTANAVSSTSKALTIGAYAGTLNLNVESIVDEVRIYNRVLSSDEIKRLYESSSIKIKNDFISVNTHPYLQTNITGTNGTTIFNSVTEEIILDGEPITTKYSTNETTVYFYDWKEQNWFLWQKEANKIIATGGNITYADGYTIHTFTSNGTFEIVSGSGNVEYLVVGGGGAGGDAQGSGRGGGGGGAGGFRTATDHAVTTQVYAITVGAGGAIQTGRGDNGGNSTFDTITSIGGGGGGGNGGSNGAAGGSGGGGWATGGNVGGLGTSGQGNSGGSGEAASFFGGGSGGGASTFGVNGTISKGGDGGNGSTSSISGSLVTYAGGGGAGMANGGVGIGGVGGGGTGADGTTTNGTAGTVNTGGGGGGGAAVPIPGAGGSGIVIVRYKKSGTPDWLDPRNKQNFKWRYEFKKSGEPSVNLTYQMTAHDPFVRTFVDTQTGIVATGGTVTYSGGNTIHTFTANGTFNVTSSGGNVEYLIIAGGGAGGGDGGAVGAGGGGAGGFQTAIGDVTLQGYAIVVGAGGIGDDGNNQGNNGGNSFFNGIVSMGGGGGGSGGTGNQSGINGGSGGGAGGGGGDGGIGIVGQGFDGGSGSSSGGGGAGAIGINGTGSEDGGDGGIGLQSDINGTNIYYAGGGAGGAYVGFTGGDGGLGGGGKGGDGSQSGFNGIDGLGGGGGGSGRGGASPGAGGSGIVILRYKTNHNISIPISLFENRSAVTTSEDGLVGYWNFNEGEGVNVNDVSGSGYTGGIIGATWDTSSFCKFGNCLTFDGTNDYVNLNSIISTIQDQTTGSISLWFNSRTQPTGGDEALFACTDSGDANSVLQIVLNNGDDKILIKSTELSANIISWTVDARKDNQWIHFVFTNGPNGNEMYVNGTNVDGTYIAGSSSTNTWFDNTLNIDSCEFGSRVISSTRGVYFDGGLDDIRIYNRVLDISEINQIYQTGINQQNPGVYFTTNNNIQGEEVLFTTTNRKNVNRGNENISSGFNITSNHTDWFQFDYVFNSTQNQNILFTLGTMGMVNTSTYFNPKKNTTEFSSESLESLANSTLTYYDLDEGTDFEDDFSNYTTQVHLLTC